MRQKLPKNQRDAVRWGRYAVILLVLLTVYFFANVWQSVSITRLLRQNSELKADLQSLKNKNALLVVQRDSLTSPERIREVLKGKVQLQNAETINIFTNDSGE